MAICLYRYSLTEIIYWFWDLNLRPPDSNLLVRHLVGVTKTIASRHRVVTLNGLVLQRLHLGTSQSYQEKLSMILLQVPPFSR